MNRHHAAGAGAMCLPAAAMSGQQPPERRRPPRALCTPDKAATRLRQPLLGASSRAGHAGQPPRACNPG